MRMRHLLLFFLLCVSSVDAQDSYKLLQSIPFRDASCFTTDQLGNSYVVVDNQLLQFGPDGKPKLNYSESSLGVLRSVDASNPMKLLLFYPDFARMVTLNSQLAPQSTIYLHPAGITEPAVGCSSIRDGYWIFDLHDFQLKKLDLNLQVVAQSGDLSQVVGHSVLPNFMTEHEGMVYLNDPQTGILVFDAYGTYYKTIPITDLKSFQLIGSELLYLSKNELHAYHLKTIDDRVILLPAHDPLRVARIWQKELYLLTDSVLNFYSF